MTTTATGLRLVLILVLSLGLTACDRLDEWPRDRPLRADPREAFPSFVPPQDAGEAQTEGVWSFDPCDAPSGTDLVGPLSVRLPVGQDGWVRATSPDGLLLVRYAATGAPRSFFHLRPLDAQGGGQGAGVEGAPPSASASLRFTTFLRQVDIRLRPSPLGASRQAAVLPGYRSDGGSFSGWKWIGPCERRAVAETAERDPSSEEPPPSASSARTEENGATKAFLRLARTEGRWQKAAGTAAPAFQVIGSATLPGRSGFGVHLALVCAEPCADAPTLARILGSFRVSSSVSPDSASPVSGNYSEMAEEVGLEEKQPDPPSSPEDPEPPSAETGSEETTVETPR